jgi:hypothetical protein
MPRASAKGKQGQIGYHSRVAMETTAVLPALDDPMIGPRSNEQNDRANEQSQAHPVHVPGMRREPREAFVEHPTETKAEQDLRAEYQNSGFVKCRLDLLR